MLSEAPKPPDVILLDAMMPDMNGQTTLAEIRKLPGYSAVPVIFMTARARQADVDAYRQAGAVGVIVKPFDPLTLARQVRGLVAAG
jgi:two-component system, OmpR family, response regulator